MHIQLFYIACNYDTKKNNFNSKQHRQNPFLDQPGNYRIVISPLSKYAFLIYQFTICSSPQTNRLTPHNKIQPSTFKTGLTFPIQMLSIWGSPMIDDFTH